MLHVFYVDPVKLTIWKKNKSYLGTKETETRSHGMFVFSHARSSAQGASPHQLADIEASGENARSIQYTRFPRGDKSMVNWSSPNSQRRQV